MSTCLSSASQAVALDSPVSYDVFVAPGLQALNGADVEARVRFLERSWGAYHAYLRKFGEDQSSGGSQASASSSGSVKSRPKSKVGRWFTRVPSPVPAALTTRVQPVGPVELDDGFCYLAGFKPKFKDVVAKEIGASPRFFDLLAQPVERFDLSSSVRVSLVGDRACHVGAQGTHEWPEVLKAVASRARMVTAPGSALQVLMSADTGRLTQYHASMVVAGKRTWKNATAQGKVMISLGDVRRDAGKLAIEVNKMLAVLNDAPVIYDSLNMEGRDWGYVSASGREPSVTEARDLEVVLEASGFQRSVTPWGDVRFDLRK